ncbi:uncharacterized protein [Drosophila tropicalis]|uniref:uncharacterized protein n=1 Tax=Drosophila tropicalis TaxID=46794 RepID=UPI0035ABCB19
MDFLLLGNEKIGTLQNCSDGYVCSNSAEVCVPTTSVDGSTIIDVCSGSMTGTNCGVCFGSYAYACASENQYVRCVNGDAVTSKVYSCDGDDVCILEGQVLGSICVSKCAAESMSYSPSCSNGNYTAVVPTIPPTTAPTTDELKAACDVASAGYSTSLYFYAIYTADSTCNSYLYCERSSLTATTSTAIRLTCPSSAAPYFDSSSGACVGTKPSNC